MDHRTLFYYHVAVLATPGRHLHSSPWYVLLSHILPAVSGGPGDNAGELLEAVEVVAGEEYVHVGQRRGHAAGERLVAGGGFEGVYPDDLVGETMYTPHRLGEHLHVPAVPTVREQDHDRAAGHPALAPEVHELLDGIPEPGPPRPVLYRACGLPQRPIRVAC